MSISLPPSFSYSLPHSKVFIIGLAGGADSGKEAFCRVLIEQLQKSQVVDSSKALLLHLHDFYKELSDEDRTRVASGLYNFDHPDAFDWDLLAQVMDDIKEGNITKLPKFNFSTKRRSYETRSKDLESPSVVLLEGIFVLYSARIRDLLNMKLFVDLDDDMRLANRVARKVAESNPDPVDHILTEYVRYVKPAFDDFIQPSKKWADIIIPRGVENTPAIELITAHAADLLGRQQQSNSTRPSRMNSGSTVLQEMLAASNPSSACPSPRSASKTSGEAGSRSSMPSSPVPRKDVLSGSGDSVYKPVPEIGSQSSCTPTYLAAQPIDPANAANAHYRKLYMSHLLTSWVDRSFEFASYILISRVFTSSPLQSSFYGVTIEKDWAMIISGGHLEHLLPTMRRIDLVCKTLSPVLMGYLLLSPQLVITSAICGWTAASTIVEYILISQLHRDIAGLSVRAPYNPTPATACGEIEEVASVLVSAREYVRHKTLLATLSLAMLYMNVFSFGGTLTTLIGYNTGLWGIMKALAGIMGVSGTYVMPVLANKIGNVRTGLWSIWQLVLTLALVVLALTHRLSSVATSVLLFGGMTASRLGLWMFDIAENLILQDYTASMHITSITGWQYSMCNLFDLLQFMLMIVVSDPAKFLIPAGISFGFMVGGAMVYTWFVWKERGHLLHRIELK
ncbi:hypothetical protein BGX28_006379 [Mortierella sp. GBA30]|nr:hypothetical protein BGX28_006379 [Mortierella sp. GBA30]